MNQRLTDEREHLIKVLKEHLAETRVMQFIPLYPQQLSEEALLILPESAHKLITELFESEQTLEVKLKEHNQVEISEWSTKVKKIYMKICKILHQHRFQVEQTSPLKPDDGLERFVYIMKEMVNIYADKIQTTKEEEQVMNDQKNEKAAREKKANADLKALQRELAGVRSTREKEVSAREDTLKKLEEELVALKVGTSAQRGDFNNQMKNREDLAQNKYAKFEDMLKDQIKQCETLIAELKLDHHKKENEMKLNRKTSEQQVYDFVTKYDNFMSEHTLKYNQLVFDYNKDQKRVVFLENAIAVMEEEKRKRNEERERKRVEKERFERTKIHSRYQRLWKRAYQLLFLTNYEGFMDRIQKMRDAKNPPPPVVEPPVDPKKKGQSTSNRTKR